MTQSLKPFWVFDGRVATGEGRLARWGRTKFVLPHCASRPIKLATKQALIFMGWEEGKEEGKGREGREGRLASHAIFRP